MASTVEPVSRACCNLRSESRSPFGESIHILPPPPPQQKLFSHEYPISTSSRPGIALRIWELGLDYPVMKPKNIGQFSYEVDLEYEEAFTLSLILSYQGLTKSEITEIMGSMSSVDKILYQLLSQELILKDENDSYRVRPEALSSVTTYMEKLRLVW